MKLMRVGDAGQERLAALDDGGVVRDLSGHVDDIAGAAITADGLAKLRALDLTILPAIDGARIGSCVGGVGKFICIGLNYADHAAESSMEVPPEPVMFIKATSAICGPNDDVIVPRGSDKCDWEVEIEDLGEGFDGYWISSPTAIIHLVDAKDGSWE